MRRHQAVHDREAGEQRDADLDQRHAGAARDDEDERREQDEADLEEERDADEEGRDHHRPVHTGLAERVDQRARDAVGAAGFGHQLAEHGPEAEQHADETERAAEAVLEFLHDLADRQAGREAEETRRDDQRDERMELEARDQDDQPDDRDGRGREQERGSFESGHRVSYG